MTEDETRRYAQRAAQRLKRATGREARRLMREQVVDTATAEAFLRFRWVWLDEFKGDRTTAAALAAAFARAMETSVANRGRSWKR